ICCINRPHDKGRAASADHRCAAQNGSVGSTRDSPRCTPVLQRKDPAGLQPARHNTGNYTCVYPAACASPVTCEYNCRLIFRAPPGPVLPVTQESMMGPFDAIRPYNDQEVPAVLARLCSDPELLAMLTRYRFP